jgi:hypothetical protein
VVAKTVARFGAEGAPGRDEGVKKRKTKFAANEEAILIRGESVVWEAPRK